MRLLVFGASGQVGQEVVRRAIADRHEVTGFVRTPGNLAVRHAMLRLVEGDVADALAVSAVMPGHDAVISALGVGKPLKPDAAVAPPGGVAASGVRRGGAVLEQRPAKASPKTGSETPDSPVTPRSSPVCIRGPAAPVSSPRRPALRGRKVLPAAVNHRYTTGRS